MSPLEKRCKKKDGDSRAPDQLALSTPHNFQLLRLSIEIQAIILRLAGVVPGVVYRAMLSSSKVLAMCCDESVCCAIWRSMYNRMPTSTPPSQFREESEYQAAQAAGQ